jgi:hypothetical protein
MTIVGIILVLVGAAVGLTSPTAYNGQWLLGFLIAIAGVALAARHTHTTKEKK